ncbi:MAG: hypothetical protein ABIO04_12035 [Ferruginibacter sp.]
MQEKHDNDRDIKPDLKHDNMSYSSATEGDDVLDTDLNMEDDNAISAEELNLIDDDTEDNRAEALNTVELDRQADNDVYFEADKEDEDVLDDFDETDENTRR